MKIIIQTPAPNFESSTKYYSDLEFHLISSTDNHQYVFDGKVIIHINGEISARLAIEVFVDDVRSTVEKLKSTNTMISDQGEYALAYTTTGVRLIVKNIVKYSQLEDFPTDIKSICGPNYGIGIETLDMRKSYKLWEALGYKIVFGNIDTDGFVGMSNNTGVDVSLFKIGSCPHSFTNFSMTYFNGKTENIEVINRIIKLGIIPVEEITHFNPKGKVDNMIISDPGGLRKFIFNDGQ